MLIRLGDTDVDYNADFKFFMTTKLANPHYPPEISVKVTIVNFTVTLKGLEDQLLANVVGNERPELEEQKNTLVVQIADAQKSLKDLEDKILYMLANASGDILEDTVLIETLKESKSTSTQIGIQLKEAEATSAMIDTAREGYRTVATRASILYFVVADMANCDPMYQYSLDYFTKLFRLTLEKSEQASPSLSASGRCGTAAYAAHPNVYARCR